MIPFVKRCLPKTHRTISRSTPLYRAVQTQTADLKEKLKEIDFMVCDMAGTTVQEGGLVYDTLQSVMNNAYLGEGRKLSVSNEQMHPWHGAKKEAVLEHFLRDQIPDMSEDEIQAQVVILGDNFVQQVTKAYFSEGSPLAPISPDLFKFFQTLRNDCGIKVGLDTGYPPEIQKLLIDALGMETEVDDYISSYQVKDGRPYPYMIHQLMERQGIMDSRRVCKVGDSARDMQMGKNAGCGLVVGVLSGADTSEGLYAAGADIVIDDVTKLLPVETQV